MSKSDLVSLTLELIIAGVVVAMFFGGGVGSEAADIQPSVTAELETGTITVTKFPNETPPEWFARVRRLVEQAQEE